MKRDYIKIFILRTIGNFLLLAACSGVFLTFAPAIKAEVKFRSDEFFGVKYMVVEDSTVPKGSAEQGSFLMPVSKEFGVVIPRIGANAKVVSNVDASDEGQYLEALKNGVAHAAGTAYPGQKGNSVLFAHSVGNFWEVNQWNAVFYLLRELEPGDEVDVFYLRKRHVYTVYDKMIVEPDQVQFLQPEADFAKLTLQTCWPPGTTFKRLLVLAKLRGG